MKRKKLPALFAALAMLAATAPVFAADEDTQLPIEPETVLVDTADVPIEDIDVFDEPIAADTAGEPIAADGTDGAGTVVAQVGEKTYTSLSEAVSNANDGDTIKLTADIDIGNTYIKIAKSITLDLNGCTLTSTHGNGAILVWGDNLTTLTIVDNSNDKTGKVLNTAKYGVWVYKGNLKLESGIIESSSDSSYAVRCGSGTSMTMTGGTVTGNVDGIQSAGTLQIDGGTVTGGQDGIFCTSGSIVINDGTVETDFSNPYVSSKGDKSAYGIYLYKNTTLKMYGGTVRGTIENTESIEKAYHTIYAIYGHDGTTIEINGGTTECTSADTEKVYPFGINSFGTLTIDDGTITTDGTAITGNGNHHNTNYIINGGTINGGLLGIYHPQDGTMKINGGIITGGLTGIEIRAGETIVNGGTITGNADHFETDENGTGSTTIGAGIAVVQHDTERAISLTVTDGKINGFVPLYEGNVHNNPQAAIDKVTIKVEGGFFTNTNLDDTDHKSVITEDVDHYMTGGMYSSEIPYDYIHRDYYRRDWHDGNFEVTKPDFTVINRARTIDGEIELVDLTGHEHIDQEPFATYKVVVSPASEAHITAITNKMVAVNDDNTKKAVFDIKVEKTDDTGAKEDITSGILEQEVKITLNNTPKDSAKVKVYYIDKENNSVVQLTDENFTVDGNKITFTAPILSTYAITYDPAEITEDSISDKIGVVFSPVVKGGNQYYILLKPLAPDKKLHRYMSADIAFKKICNDGRVIYEIEPAEYMNATLLSENGDSREYHFEMDGINVPDASCDYGEGIMIGTITFSGYGTVDLRVDIEYATAADIEHTVNIANTAKIADNIVDNYTVDANTLVVNETVDAYGAPALKEDETGTIQATFSPGKATLTVNIAFNNAVNVKDNKQDYQDMTVTISGGDLTTDKVIKLGNDSNPKIVEIPEDASAYKITCDDLTRNVAYNIKVEGAGYRTAHYLVLMTGDKTLNFWNNVKDNAEVIEVGKETGKVTNNFLAGDIVKDNEINIYDLSAVVSYFGTDNLVSAHPEYAKYDLNRDGVIDSKDVAYVLVSWGN